MNNYMEIALYRFRYLMPWFLGLAFVVSTIAITLRCLAGFDITDEGYYLLWISGPTDFDAGTSTFGFIINPLFEIFHGNFVALRVVNVLSIVFLVTFLVRELFCLFVPDFKLSWGNFFVFIAPISITTLMFFPNSQTTPSYNTLTMQLLLVASILVIKLMETQTYNYRYVAICLGITLTFTFFSKPTSGVFLSFTVCCLILLICQAGKKIQSILYIFLGVALTAASAIYCMFFLGKRFPYFFVEGAKLWQLFDPHYEFKNILRIDFDINFHQAALIAFWFFIFLNLIVNLVNRKPLPTYSLLLIFVLTTFFIISSENSQSLIVMGTTPFFFYVFIGTVGFICYSFFAYQWKIPGKISVLLGLFFFCLPWIFVVGTNGNYFQAESKASIFWVIAIVVLLLDTIPLEKFKNAIFAGLGIVFTLVVAVSVIQTIGNPYRQAPGYFNQFSLAEIGPEKTKVFVSEDFGEFIKSATKQASLAGLKPDTPIIDLTGESPGVVYLLGAKSISQPWLLGGYAGSDSFVTEVLKNSKCQQLNRAWVLMTTENDRFVSQNLLHTVNLNLDDQYELAASWLIPSGYGSSGEAYVQYLFKPLDVHSNHATNCAKA